MNSPNFSDEAFEVVFSFVDKPLETLALWELNGKVSPDVVEAVIRRFGPGLKTLEWCPHAVRAFRSVRCQNAANSLSLFSSQMTICNAR